MTQGDLLYAATNIGNGTYGESMSTLSIGANNSILQSNGTVPFWSDSLTLADLTVDNIQIAVTDTNEIDTVVGNLTIDSAGGTVTVDDNLIVSGDLTVNGTVTTVNSTTVTVDDKNIELGSVATPSDATADGGGITLKATSDKTITWISSTNRWTTNVGFEATAIENTPIGANNEESGKFTTLESTGQATLSSAAVSDLTENGIVIAGSSGELTTTADVSFSSNNLSVNGTITQAGHLIQTANSIDTTDTSQYLLGTFNTTSSGAKFFITYTEGTARHISEVLVTHDGTTAIATEYGSVFTGSVLFTVEVDISGSDVRILGTPANAASGTFKITGQILT